MYVKKNHVPLAEHIVRSPRTAPNRDISSQNFIYM